MARKTTSGREGPEGQMRNSVSLIRAELEGAATYTYRLTGYRHMVPPVTFMTQELISKEYHFDDGIDTVPALFDSQKKTIVVNVGRMNEALMPGGCFALPECGSAEGHAMMAQLILDNSKRELRPGALAHEYFHGLQQAHATSLPFEEAIALRDGGRHRFWLSAVAEAGGQFFEAAYLSKETKGDGERAEEICMMMFRTFTYRSEFEMIGKIVEMLSKGGGSKGGVFGAIHDSATSAKMPGYLEPGFLEHAAGATIAVVVLVHNGMDVGKTVRDLLDQREVKRTLEHDSEAGRAAAALIGTAMKKLQEERDFEYALQAAQIGA